MERDAQVVIYVCRHDVGMEATRTEMNTQQNANIDTESHFPNASSDNVFFERDSLRVAKVKSVIMSSLKVKEVFIINFRSAPAELQIITKGHLYGSDLEQIAQLGWKFESVGTRKGARGAIVMSFEPIVRIGSK
jgi:hypothetical protein